MTEKVSPKPTDLPGTVFPPSDLLPGRPARRRVSINMTVHPDTIARLDHLASRFESHRGQVIDRLVWVLFAAYESGKVLCCDGRVCVVGRADLPAIL